jgi:hypothetical protein
VFARSRIGAAIAIAAVLSGCQRRESVEDSRNRTLETLLIAQIADLKALLAKTEAGQLDVSNRIAIGISEETSKAILDASLPQEQVVGDRVRVRIEKAQPFFQGNNALLLFEATPTGLKTGAHARLELGGRLVNFRVDEGRLRADVELVHFRLLDSSLPDVGNGVLESLIQQHLGALAKLTPDLEIPVRLEHSIAIGGLDAGVVQARGGALPLAMSVSEVVPINKRLWVFLEVKAGPWERKAQVAQGKQ